MMMPVAQRKGLVGIDRRLFLSQNTVQTRARRKLRTASKADAIALLEERE